MIHYLLDPHDYKVVTHWLAEAWAWGDYQSWEDTLRLLPHLALTS